MAVALAAVALASCGDSDRGVAVPRQHAYPRVAEYDSAYVATDLGGVDFDINRQARLTEVAASEPGVTGVNITYDKYAMTVYVTVIRAANDFDSRLEERLKRVSLNLGSVPAESTPTVSVADWSGTVVRALSVSSTPVQALARDKAKRTIFTATLFIDNPGTDPDSLAPMIDVVERDMIHTLGSLK